jgi:hypothetical protein
VFVVGALSACSTVLVLLLAAHNVSIMTLVRVVPVGRAQVEWLVDTPGTGALIVTPNLALRRS